MVNEKETKTVAKEQVGKKLIVERNTFTTKDNREMWNYFIKGKVRGRDVQVDFVASDQGGYEVLDIIFDIKSTAELVMHNEVMVNDDGVKNSYTVYEVQNVDENGEVYSYPVKLARKSDKSLLAFMLIDIKNAERIKARQEERAKKDGESA